MREKKRFMSEILVVALETILLVCIVFFAVIPMSCKITQEGIQVIGGDYSTPVLENVTVVDDTTLELSFSESVDLTDVVVSTVLNGVSDSNVHSPTESLSSALKAACGERGKIPAEIESLEEGKRFVFHFQESTIVGHKYEVFGVVHDSVGNSLTFCVPFVGFNAQFPKIIMTEVQTRYAKAKVKTGDEYRSEFVEFLALSDGNLAGFELISATDGDDKKYVFPAIEVQKGQVFVVHLRTAGEGCISELENYDEATGTYSCTSVLDLWSENTAARLHDTNDVIILWNSIEKKIVDAVMYAAEDSTEWKTDVGEFAVRVCEAGIYESDEIDYASCSKGVTPKKSLQRIDAKDILLSLETGIEIEYPIVVDAESWNVMEITPGII